MDANFSIQVGVGLSLVRITLRGFFEPADVARFVAARDLAHQQLRCGPNEHLTLVNITDMQIQSQESVIEFQRVLSTPETASKRIAFVVAKSLARSQIQRAAQARSAGYFQSTEEAEHWLLTGDAAAAA